MQISIRTQRREIEEIDVTAATLQHLLGEFAKAKSLRNFSRSRAIVPCRRIDNQNKGERRRVALPCLSGLDPLTGRPPFNG